MADKLVKGPNNTLIRYSDQGDGTHAEVVSAVGGVGAGLVDGDYGDVVVSGTGTVMTLDSGVVSTFSKTLLDDTTAAGWKATLGITNSGTGTLRVYRPTSYTTIGTSTLGASARIAIPAGQWGPNAIAKVYFMGGKVTTGVVDTPSIAVYVGVTGFTPSGGTNRMATAFPTPASANGQVSGAVWIMANKTDLTTVTTTQQANNCNPFSQSITFAGKVTSSTLNLANAWDICVTFSTGANDTAAISDAWVEIIDVDGITTGAVTSEWQTYTPNVSNAVPITIDRDSGPNVILNAPVDDIQVVAVPSNMQDGEEMEIDLVGGDGSGSWTTWSSGTPTTAGYVFLVSGVAPTADASATMCTPCFVKRRGYKYEVTVAPVKVL